MAANTFGQRCWPLGTSRLGCFWYTVLFHHFYRTNALYPLTCRDKLIKREMQTQELASEQRSTQGQYLVLPQLLRGQMLHPVLHTPQSPQLFKPIYELLTMFDVCITSRRMSRALSIIEGLRNELDAEQLEEMTLQYLSVAEAIVFESNDMSFFINAWTMITSKCPVLLTSAVVAQLCQCAFLVTDVAAGNELVNQFCLAFTEYKPNGDIIDILKTDILRPEFQQRFSELCSLPSTLIENTTTNDVEKKSIESEGNQSLWNQFDTPPDKRYSDSQIETLSFIVCDEIQSVNKHFHGESVLIPSKESRKKELLDFLPILKQTKTLNNGIEALHSSLNFLLNPGQRFEIHDDSFESLPIYKNHIYELSRQKMLERSADEAAGKRWEEAFDKNRLKLGLISPSRSLNALLWNWHKEFVPLIQEYLKEAKKRENEQAKIRKKHLDCNEKVDKAACNEKEDFSTRKVSGKKEIIDAEMSDCVPYLCVLPPPKLSIITILEMIRLYGACGFTNGIRLSRVFICVGKALEREYQARILRSSEARKILGSGVKIREIMSNEEKFGRALAKYNKVGQKSTAHEKPMIRAWSQEVRAKIGNILVELLMKCAKVKQVLPGCEVMHQESAAFYHSYHYQGHQSIGIINYHDELIAQMSRKPIAGTIHCSTLPMLIPPLPWTDWKSGGYLYSSNMAMRIKDAPEQKNYLQAASERGELDQIFRGLDVLGKTAWTTNTKIFELILQIWNSGEAFPGFPPERLRIEETEYPIAQNISSIREHKRIANEIADNLSQRCELNYKVEVARAFMNERFYFPHSLDFRGRAYPIPTYFHHLGNDLSRAMLLFDEAKELGPKGLIWLKIHFANLCGHDKESLKARLEFTESQIDNIYEAADNPLDGTKWWTNYEECWQILATCFELTSALRSSDPEKYKSRMPVHQDGSCNGLQHYAALGGDIEGAKQVNLYPGSEPRDVYTAVAIEVAKQVEKDSENPASRYYQHAKQLKNKITRKVIKQSVMTNVYGVTFVGMREQIQTQLLKIPGIVTTDTYIMATYLAHVTSDIMKNLFRGAHEIQMWLFDSAMKISKSMNPSRPGTENMSSVIWTTPLRLPIVQPYRSQVRKEIKTTIQIMKLRDPDAVLPVLSRKQATAFPPNFIHSLDATHMIMSALECDANGIAFAAVHDSYWTHACDVDAMGEIIRDQFIRLHKQDIMKNLKEEFENRYKNNMLTISVPIDSPDGHRLLSKQHKSEEPTTEHKSKARKFISGKTSLEFKPLPERGMFDINLVRQSTYFFS